jgi:medium-chain acyl-[acyl-carrier-protein] hydrolase
MIIFERKYPVNIFNTDLTGRLSPGSLFSFFEDLAGRHADLLGWGRDNLISNGYFWALSRMTVKIQRMPSVYDEVTLRTWPRGTDTVFALRDLEMYDAAGIRMAGAASSWVIVDYQTRRAQRPDKALLNMNFLIPEAKALDSNAVKIPPIPSGDHQITILKVKLDDIDVNRHVNNARYVHWVMNCYEPEFIITHIPETIEVNYLNEGHLGEMINIFTANGSTAGAGRSSGAVSPAEKGEGAGTQTGSNAGDWQPESFTHSICRESDNTELCRIRINWRNEAL